jgi:hypothetical protein
MGNARHIGNAERASSLPSARATRRSVAGEADGAGSMEGAAILDGRGIRDFLSPQAKWREMAKQIGGERSCSFRPAPSKRRVRKAMTKVAPACRQVRFPDSCSASCGRYDPAALSSFQREPE